MSLTWSAEICSPNRQVRLQFYVDNGNMTYRIFYKDKEIVRPSHLGLQLINWADLDGNFVPDTTITSSFSETWKPVWGEEDEILNSYNELAATVRQTTTNRRITVRFRVYDEGVGFRYELPRQQQLDNVWVKQEQTQFAMCGNHTAYWIPGDYDTSEYEYRTCRLTEIRQMMNDAITANACQSPFSPTGVQTSLLMKTDDGIYINIHEAALTDYSAMHLELNDTTLTLTSRLTPDSEGRMARMHCPAHTPWRTVIITDNARDMLASRMTLNLNEPCKIEDTSWIHPIKYVGVWWEMMSGAATWNYADYQHIDIEKTDYTKLPTTGRHAANNSNVMRYIDFAADNSFDAVLVEGWNKGWEDSWQKLDNYSFTQSYPDYDLKKLSRYAEEKGVKIIMHHETSASVLNYERQLDDAYRLATDNGCELIKSGYVGPIFPYGGHHFDQWMVDHYLHAVKRAADFRLMVNAHEAVRPTGLCRTYPNLLCNESARGQEFYATDGFGTQHTTILPFTRLMGGPMDFTPGLLESDLSKVNPENKNRISSTVCNQLALYIIMYSPLQMAADVPESYERYADAFQFIKDVPADWSQSHYVEAEPGQYITVARREKNGERWFVGSITAVDRRKSRLELNFLKPGKEYTATIYCDAKDADNRQNQARYTIRKQRVTSKSVLTLTTVNGGGYAISIVPTD